MEGTTTSDDDGHAVEVHFNGNTHGEEVNDDVSQSQQYARMNNEKKDQESSTDAAKKADDVSDDGYEEGFGNEPRAAAEEDMNESEPSHRTIHRPHVVTANDAPFDTSYHPCKRMMGYSPPCQRQKWRETQILPRVNWGDLFFDLHYVAGTYNVSNILVRDPSAKGLLFAAGTFLPIMGMWLRNSYHAARFSTDDDLFHRCFQIGLLVVLATTVLHIRPVDIMENSRDNISMFVFCLCCTLEQVMYIVKYAELYFWGVGQRANLKHVAVREVKITLMIASFYLGATLVAALEFFPRQSSYRRALAGGDENEQLNSDNDDDYDDSSGNDVNDTPIGLCLGGVLFSLLYLVLNVFFCIPQDGKHKEITVPLNVDFVLHRFGEWIMLMMGESIFSILIVSVDEESKEHYGTFYASILSVILLQYLHFTSQPHHADGHAMRRSIRAGIVWHVLNHAYSLALVCLGAAFTFFLTDFNDSDDRRRQLAGGGGDDGLSGDTRQKRAATLFSESLATVFLCLDGMTLLHLGFHSARNRCVCPRSKKRNYIGIVLVLIRVALIFVTATMTQFTGETSPEKLSLWGFAAIIVQLIIRKLGNHYLKPPETAIDASDHDDDLPSATWPNVTVAQANHPSGGDDGNDDGKKVTTE